MRGMWRIIGKIEIEDKKWRRVELNKKIMNGWEKIDDIWGKRKVGDSEEVEKMKVRRIEEDLRIKDWMNVRSKEIKE